MDHSAACIELPVLFPINESSGDTLTLSPLSPWCIETDPRPLGPASKQSPPPPPANWCRDVTWRPLVRHGGGWGADVSGHKAHYPQQPGHLDIAGLLTLRPICNTASPLTYFVIANTNFLSLIRSGCTWLLIKCPHSPMLCYQHWLKYVIQEQRPLRPLLRVKVYIYIHTEKWDCETVAFKMPEHAKTTLSPVWWQHKEEFQFQ